MSILESALNWGKEKYPKASNYHHSAFANSVNYLVSGWSGGYGGPSMREHAVSWSLAGDGYNLDRLQFPDGRLKRAGQWSFDEALSFCEPICYGSLPSICKRIAVEEYCFNDDPEDLAEL